MKSKEPTSRIRPKEKSSIGERIIVGLEEAIAWSKGENVPVRVTQVRIPDLDLLKRDR